MGDQERIRSGAAAAVRNGDTRRKRFYVRVVFPAYLFLAVYAFRQLKQALRVTTSGEHGAESSFLPSLSNYRKTKPQTPNEPQQQPSSNQQPEQDPLRALESWLGLQDDNEDDDEEEDDDAEEEENVLEEEEVDGIQQKLTLEQRMAREMNEYDNLDAAERKRRFMERLKQKQARFASGLKDRGELYEMPQRQGKMRRRRQGGPWGTPEFNGTNPFYAPPNIKADFSKYPILESQILPDMTTDMGGVIFFIHVPKVGGQTIRYGFSERKRSRFRGFLDRVDYDRELSKRKMRNGTLEGDPDPIKKRVRYITANWLHVFEERGLPMIDAYLKRENNKGKILFVEVHGEDNYHALELEPFIHNWRGKAKASGVPFFAFTLLREAISAQVSFFNFYYIHPGDSRFCKNPLARVIPSSRCSGGEGKRRKSYYRRIAREVSKISGINGNGTDLDTNNQTSQDKLREAFFNTTKIMTPPPLGAVSMAYEDLENHLVKLSYENPQCLFLARGERTFGDDPDKIAKRSNLKRAECQSLYLSLRRTMDWIGSTDTLSSETLPMLTTIMFQNASIGKSLPRLNTSPEQAGFLKLSELKKSTINALERKSQLDQELFHRAKQDYTLDQWMNDTNF